MTKDFEKIRKEMLNKYDLAGDGIITEEELDILERIVDIESKKAKEKDRDQREDAQRKMAWFSLLGMLLYPLSIVITTWMGLIQAAEILGTMASIYFVSVAAIVAAFFGSQAYQNSHPGPGDFDDESSSRRRRS
jgi:hypothetical protein